MLIELLLLVDVCRSVLLRQNCQFINRMVQPTMQLFSFRGPPHPVSLEASSVEDDGIMLLDTFFHIVVYHGQKIRAWKKQKLEENPQYAQFAKLLKHPVHEGKVYSSRESVFPPPFPSWVAVG